MNPRKDQIENLPGEYAKRLSDPETSFPERGEMLKRLGELFTDADAIVRMNEAIGGIDGVPGTGPNEAELQKELFVRMKVALDEIVATAPGSERLVPLVESLFRLAFAATDPKFLKENLRASEPSGPWENVLDMARQYPRLSNPDDRQRLVDKILRTPLHELLQDTRHPLVAPDPAQVERDRSDADAAMPPGPVTALFPDARSPSSVVSAGIDPAGSRDLPSGRDHGRKPRTPKN